MRNFAPQAQADLDEAVSWLLDHGHTSAGAERLLTSVLEAAALLARRPVLGRHRADLLPHPYRFWSILRHRLILVYDSSTEPPTILRVLSTDRDLGPLLSDLQGLHSEPDGE
jgi:plasmid stabilization system protein ParE